MSPQRRLAAGVLAWKRARRPHDAYPPSAQAGLAAVGESLNRARARAEETGEPLLDRPCSAALRTLRASAAEDQHAFGTALSDPLVRESTLHGPSAFPSSLLPLAPIALAALAYRTLGRAPAVPTGYLPHTLITGSRAEAPGSWDSAGTGGAVRWPRTVQGTWWGSDRTVSGP
ncbi:Imm49 family immunity protein [Streptomyces sp. NPDC097107]|uniref:Imm49 family immunity protein n=1 Tax=Streptomyces sp. NPDC097107 TaxID=3366089 RepID=UPI003827F2C8